MSAWLSAGLEGFEAEEDPPREELEPLTELLLVPALFELPPERLTVPPCALEDDWFCGEDLLTEDLLPEDLLEEDLVTELPDERLDEDEEEDLVDDDEDERLAVEEDLLEDEEALLEEDDDEERLVDELERLLPPLRVWAFMLHGVRASATTAAAVIAYLRNVFIMLISFSLTCSMLSDATTAHSVPGFVYFLPKDGFIREGRRAVTATVARQQTITRTKNPV